MLGAGGLCGWGGRCDESRGSGVMSASFPNIILTLGFIQKHSDSDSISFIIKVRGTGIGLGKLNCRRHAQTN